MVIVMEWSGVKINNTIEVYYGPFLKGQYNLLQEPFCHVCAHSGVTTDSCSWHHSMYGLERIYAMGKYIPPPRRAKEDLLSYHIWGFKTFKNYAQPLGKSLVLTVQSLYTELLDSSLMVPIPLHSDKLKERGYNQSLELANVVGDSLNIPVKEVLLKTQNVDMRTLNWEERREAVKGLYSFQSNVIKDIQSQRILLIDDVATACFTLSECASLLKDSGAASVKALIAGRTIL